MRYLSWAWGEMAPLHVWWIIALWSTWDISPTGGEMAPIHISWIFGLWPPGDSSRTGGEVAGCHIFCGCVLGDMSHGLGEMVPIHIWWIFGLWPPGDISPTGGEVARCHILWTICPCYDGEVSTQIGDISPHSNKLKFKMITQLIPLLQQDDNHTIHN